MENPLGATTYRTRLKTLKRDIRIRVLSSQELASVHDAMLFTNDVATADVSFDWCDTEEQKEMYSGKVLAYMHLLDVCSGCIDKFDEILVAIGAIDDDNALIAAINEIYAHVVHVNPAVDLPYFEMTRVHEAMDDDLEAAVDLLPYGNISSMYLHALLMPDLGEVVYMSTEQEEALAEALQELPEEEVKARAVVPESKLVIDLEAAKALGERLRDRVVGQELAISHMESVVKRIAVGFRDETRPPAVLLFAGPTGVGKTLLPKETANILFGEGHFGRIDCAALSDKHTSAKLFGAPPGYIGFPDTRDGKGKDKDPALLFTETRGLEDGGILLLDEVEKAHPDIWDAFLTIFDEGYAKTSAGNTIDLRNVIIVMTTNLGTKEMRVENTKNPLGFTGAAAKVAELPIEQVRRLAKKALEEYMKPELVGRITEVVPFRSLTEDEMLKVVDIEWGRSGEFVQRKSAAAIVLEESLKREVAHRSSEKGYGARLVSRLLDLYVIDPLAEFYLSGGSERFADPNGEIHVLCESTADNARTILEDAEHNDLFGADIKESSLVA